MENKTNKEMEKDSFFIPDWVKDDDIIVKTALELMDNDAKIKNETSNGTKTVSNDIESES